MQIHKGEVLAVALLKQTPLIAQIVTLLPTVLLGGQSCMETPQSVLVVLLPVLPQSPQVSHCYESVLVLLHR